MTTSHQQQGGGQPAVAKISFMDHESKIILNRIYDKLEELDHKMGFVTEYLIKKFEEDAFRSADLFAQKLAAQLQTSPPQLPPLVKHAAEPEHQHQTQQQEPPSRPASSQILLNDGRRSSSSRNGGETSEGRGESSERRGAGTPSLLIANGNNDNNDDNNNGGRDHGGGRGGEPQFGIQEFPDIPPNTNSGSNTALSEFSTASLRRAAEKASKSFSSTQPKVFAWQMFRESHTDDESALIKIPLRTSQGERVEHFLHRQTPKIRGIALATLEYFGWDKAPNEIRLAKAKLICSHIKNNAKVRNWTLREGSKAQKSPSMASLLSSAVGVPAAAAAAGIYGSLLPEHFKLSPLGHHSNVVDTTTPPGSNDSDLV